MPQLDTLTFSSQIFWLIISFSILCFILTKTYIPKLGQAIQSRRQKLIDDRNHSSKLNEEARLLMENSSTTLLQARAEAAKILRRTTNEVSHEKTQRLQEFDEKLAQISKNERETLFKAHREIETHLNELVSETVALAAEKIFQCSPKETDIKKVVTQVLLERKHKS